MNKNNLGIILISILGFIQCQTQKEYDLPKKNIYWGDIHNHCNIGYAKGSLERAYEIAQSHLDFYCFTPHSQWHDQPVSSSLERFKEAYKDVKGNWGKVQQYANEAYSPGKFVPFIGYEWHSSMYGDVCLIMPDDDGELVYLDDIRKLQKFARENDAILIPHHPAYKLGMRGQNWEFLGPLDVSPVVEIFSEHGNAESDRSPHRYLRHSMGGRYTKNTVQHLWSTGRQVGVVGSTDDHLGYPGAYGEGLVAVHADELTREGVMEAIKARRTYAVSADRIALDFRLNGHWMGEAIPAEPSRDIYVEVTGKDVIDRIEVLRNNKIIYRHFPADNNTGEANWDKPVLCRLEFGWGAWGGFDMQNVTDWEFDIQVTNGKLLSTTPCFQSGPYEEHKRNKITNVDDTQCQFISYTSRSEAYEEQATNSVVLELQGSQKTKLTISLTSPKKLKFNKTLGDLVESNEIYFTGEMPSESVMLHRLVFYEDYHTTFSYRDKRQGDTTDWYYIRAVQSNGSMAWSSPIWLNTLTDQNQ